MSEYSIRPLSRLQTITARNMHRAMQETAHATLHCQCDVTALVAALQRQPDAERLSVSDHVVYALLQTLREQPALNAHLATDELCVYEAVKLGFMVASGQGVMMACIPDAGALGRRALAGAMRDLYARARRGRFEVAETRGATFMVADLSAYPVDTFTPILLPSAIAIVGIGRMRAACWPTPQGCRPGHLLTLNLTFDHRGTDALAAGRFLAGIVRRLEQPES